MESFKEYVEKTECKFISEASLSRIWQHTNNLKRCFLMISAYRGNRTNSENVDKGRELEKLVRAENLTFFWLNGKGWENKGTSEEQFIEEKSLFVIGNENDNGRLLGLGRKWVIAFDQESFAIKNENEKTLWLHARDLDKKCYPDPKDNSKEICHILQDANGRRLWTSGKWNKMNLGDFTPMKIGQYYWSELPHKKGKIFTYESIELMDRESSPHPMTQMRKRKVYESYIDPDYSNRTIHESGGLNGGVI